MAPLLRRLMRRRVLGVALAFILGGATVGVAVAASTVVRDTTNVRLRVIQSDFADGFDSGWHTHPGVVIVQVQKGRFKIYQGSCKPTVVGKGETYLEVPFVPVRAVAKGSIKWTTSQILPAGEDPQTVAASPC
jgi:quercetin dioxygenase-like cupin family protein